MPVRGPRALYRILSIQENLDDDPAAVDDAPDETEDGTRRPIFALIKRPIGDFLGLVPIAWNDPIFTGTFQTTQGSLNEGSLFRRRIGGFRVASYTLIAVSTFEITELVKQDNGEYEEVLTPFKSISIGLPKGHSVTEFINFMGTTGVLSQVATIKTPAGHGIPIAMPVAA